MMTERQNEATETRAEAVEEFRIAPADKKLYGTTDWYVVRTLRSRVTVRRERDIKPGEVTLGGPYFTKDQAKCENYWEGQKMTHEEANRIAQGE